MIALYRRVSTSEQAENGYSIDEQEERMRAYCDAMGWKPLKVYTDAGFSGGNTDRPALQQLIRDVKNGKIERVLVYKLDRLSRSQLDTLYLIEKVFLANSCDFVSMSENFDTGSPFGRAMIGILAVFAQLEREQIKERMKMGKVARAKSGKFCGTWAVAIGYDYKDGELVTNDFEKSQVIDIFNWYASGVSPVKIADRLNEAGRYHKNGKWLPERVRRVLERKTYLGYVYYDGEWYEGSHEAFISEELFDKVQRIRGRKSEEHKEHNRRSGLASSYLGGFLICKKCGRKYVKCMSTHTLKDGTKSVYYTYRCQTRAKKNKYYDDGVCSNRNWKMQELDGMVFDQIKKLRLEGVQAEPKMNDETVQSIQLKISDISEQIDRLLSLYSVGGIPLDAVQKKMQALTDQRSKLEDEVDRLQYDTKLSLSEVTPIVESFEGVLDSGDLDDIRAVIGSLIDRIELDGDDVSIFWRF